MLFPGSDLPLGERCAGFLTSDTYWSRFVPQAFGGPGTNLSRTRLPVVKSVVEMRADLRAARSIDH